MYAICSESQQEANRALVEWNLGRDFAAVVGDRNNIFTHHIMGKYLPRLRITDCSKKMKAEAIDPKFTTERYPHGAVQPALLFFVGEKVAIGWSVVPNAANLGGALGRPSPEEVWKIVENYVMLVEDGKDFEMVDGATLTMTGASCAQAARNCCCIVM
uniref:Uncharacterized protein n=1 Tax=Odontella aurita TaxID=265563 RepID=A0A7S4M5N3_9STRA|mmetsp:Transcript_11355/g.33439  ORF Transcript_11355/g.33439 Transcript_11355/m.33439 type:complete len:158 (+) Transcript_11355:567-1040(+)